jgi:hypothetical protein
MRPVVAQLKREGVKVYEVDCSSGVPAKYARYRVSAFPTFVVLDSENRIVGRKVGACRKEVLVELLRRAK